MDKYTSSLFCLFFLILVGTKTGICDETRKKGTDASMNFAEDLINTAKSAGYDLKIEDIDLAASAVNEQEVVGALPLPVAEKLIGHRRRNDLDILREQMIGMIFTGKPQILGHDLRRNFRIHGPGPPPANRRRFRARPKRPPMSDRPRFHGMSDSEKPREILKPIPFVPRYSNIEFPVSPLQPPDLRSRRPRPNQPPRKINKFQPRRPDSSHRESFSESSFGPENSHPIDVFSNNVGPDFGPVTFEMFGPGMPTKSFDEHETHSPNDFHQIPSDFHKPSNGFHKPPNDRFLNPSNDHHKLSNFFSEPTNDFHKPTNDFHKPSDVFQKPPNNFHKPNQSKRPLKPPKRPSGFSSTSFGHFDEFPKLTNNFPPNFDTDLQKFESPVSPAPPLGGGYSELGKCYTYTEDICIDAENYPHEAILSSLAGDPSRTDTLMAEVKEQSADDLVDGISAAQESRYNFAHYFGNRRQDVSASVHRDFAQEGGYLCPSEVKYARPKRARNSKGKWKFIVNMDKYTQTIRMEKCMKPGGTCSYVSHHYRAMCNQIYNYQRLLSWNKKRGLHMDIFKVPACCSCHIQGYSYVFPPLNKPDSKISRSDNIEIDPEDEFNQAAPPYSPVNYPNLPEERRPFRRRPSSQYPRSQGNRRFPGSRQTESRTRQQQVHSIRRSNEADSRVNYGYHPIIDFFENTNR